MIAVVTIDPRPLVAAMSDLDKQQLPFATMLALGRGAEEAQDKTRIEMHHELTIRNATFMDRLIKIKADDRPTKSNLVARIRIEGPAGSEQKGDILARHIDGGIRSAGGHAAATALLGGKFFIPSEVIRFPMSAVVPRKLYPTNLQLIAKQGSAGVVHAQSQATTRGAIQLKGNQRTFVLNYPDTNVPMGVFERGGGTRGRTGKADIKLIWWFSSNIRLHERFPFFEIAQESFTEGWTKNFQGFWAYALRTAR